MQCSLIKCFCLQRCPENFYPTLRHVYLVLHNEVIFGSNPIVGNYNFDDFDDFDNSDGFDNPNDFEKADRNENNGVCSKAKSHDCKVYSDHLVVYHH